MVRVMPGRQVVPYLRIKVIRSQSGLLTTDIQKRGSARTMSVHRHQRPYPGETRPVSPVAAGSCGTSGSPPQLIQIVPGSDFLFDSVFHWPV